MTFTARQVLTAAQLNDLEIDTLTTTGNVTVGGTLTATIGAAGSDGQIQYNNGGSFGGASGLYYDDVNSRVGIGTTTPGARLEVAGSGLNATRIEGSVIGSVNDGYELNIVGGTPDSYTNAGGRIRLGGGARGDADIDSIIFMADTTERMRISSSGNVGIGTTTPQTRLGVNGDIDLVGVGRQIVFGRQSEAGPHGLEVWDSGSLETALYYRTTPNAWSFENSSGTDILTVDIPNSRVGIGTATPDYLLTIEDTTPIVTVRGANTSYAEIRAHGSGSGTGALYAGQSSTFGGGIFYNGDGSPAYATGEGADRISFFRRNSGTNEVVFSYAYNSNSVNFRGNVDVDGSLTFPNGSINSTGYLTVGSTANINGTLLADRVGINNGSPSQLLHITAGSIQLDSLYGIIWSNGDSLIYDDGSNEYQFTGDGDTDLVCDGFVILDSGVTLSNSGATYGTMNVSNYTRGSYYGVVLSNVANFMMNTTETAAGLYWDNTNEWMLYSSHNSHTRLHHNGSEKFRTESYGMSVSGYVAQASGTYSHSNCGGTPNQMAFRWVNPSIKGSVDNVVCATLGTVSDVRFKKDIESWDGGIDVLRGLRPVTYTPRDILAWGEVSMEPIEGFEERGQKHGLIAQEVQEVMPTAVDGGDTFSGYLSLNDDELIAMLISAVQNIDSRVTALGA